MMSGYTQKIVNAISKYAIDTFKKPDWVSLALEAEASDIIVDHERLLRSLSWHDDDYSEHVVETMPRVLRRANALIDDHLDLGRTAELFPGLMEYLFSNNKPVHGILVNSKEGLPDQWASVPPTTSAEGLLSPQVEDTSPVEPSREDPSPAAMSNNRPKQIFIVHGHDVDFRREVELFVRDVTGSIPIVLSDQANAGDTVIEKFERESEGASFAIILLTPDDLGSTRTSVEAAGGDGEKIFKALTSRARENVIFEWGYFCAKIGRKNTAAINRGATLPSDLAGYVWAHDELWREALRKDFKGAGIQVVG